MTSRPGRNLPLRLLGVEGLVVRLACADLMDAPGGAHAAEDHGDDGGSTGLRRCFRKRRLTSWTTLFGPNRSPAGRSTTTPPPSGQGRIGPRSCRGDAGGGSGGRSRSVAVTVTAGAPRRLIARLATLLRRPGEAFDVQDLISGLSKSLRARRARNPAPSSKASSAPDSNLTRPKRLRLH